jgi:hypothetical protein
VTADFNKASDFASRSMSGETKRRKAWRLLVSLLAANLLVDLSFNQFNHQVENRQFHADPILSSFQLQPNYQALEPRVKGALPYKKPVKADRPSALSPENSQLLTSRSTTSSFGTASPMDTPRGVLPSPDPSKSSLVPPRFDDRSCWKLGLRQSQGSGYSKPESSGSPFRKIRTQIAIRV